MTRFRNVLLLVAALAAPALGQDTRTFVIEGDDVSGLARVQGTSVALRYRTFSQDHPDGVLHEVEGSIEEGDDGLRLELERRYEARRGVVSRLLTPWRDGESRVETQVVPFSAAEDGAFTGELFRFDADGRPVEEDGERVLDAVTLRPQRPLGDEVAVLVVPGLSTNLWNQYGVPYLDENLAALRARGLRARRLPINTEESVPANAAAIAREVRREVAAGRRVVLIAHSKGGADTITALADPANRDVLPHVVGLVAIQPVYGGSPIADFIGAGNPVDDLADAALMPIPEALREPSRRLVRGVSDLAFAKLLPFINRETSTGSPGAWRDLQTEARRTSLAEHPYPADRIPTVVVRGYTQGRRFVRFVPVPGQPLPLVLPVGRHVLRQPLVIFQRYTEHELGVRTDGMVDLANQRVPGSVGEVTLADLDHFEPGFRGESPHTPCKITHLGLDMLLDHLEGASQRSDGRPAIDAPLGE